MSWKNLRLLAPALALLLFGIAPAVSTYADGSSLEVLEVRSDGFPRVIVRLKQSGSDGPSIAAPTPEHLRVTENGKLQPSADVRQIGDAATPTSVALALDVSDGMRDADKLKMAQTAAEHFIQQMPSRDQFVLVTFSDEVIVPQPLTSDSNVLVRSVNALAAGGSDRHMFEAVAQGLTQLSLGPTGPRALIVLTDGKANTTARTLHDDVAQAVRLAVPIYAIGLSTDADTEVLQRLSGSTGGHYYAASTAQDLTPAFQSILRQLSAQYEVAWQSNSDVLAGQDVAVRVSLDQADGSPAVADLIYTPPFGTSVQAPSNPVEALVELAPGAAPTEQQATTAGVIAGASVFLLLLGLVRRRVNRRLQARLTTYVAGQPELDSTDARQANLSVRHTRLSPLTLAAARVTARLVPSKYIKQLRKKLIQAGYPSNRHLNVFLAAEFAMTLLFGSVSYQLLRMDGMAQRSPSSMMIIVAMLALLGTYLPYVWLRRRMEWRKRELLRALPDALDLMSISVTAGLSLDTAMAEVVHKWDGELPREFNQVLNEMRLGANRRDALRALAERTQLQDLQLLIAALLQADELGGNVSDVLSVQAEQLRIRRRQTAEEKARKAPIKMLIPLVVFIFPAMFVVVLAPAFLQIGSMFGSIAHHG